MKINEENMQWALAKLANFAGWRGYPQNDGDTEGRARAFLRLVHNKPFREILFVNQDLVAICKKYGDPVPEIDWEKKDLDPDQNDAEWILDLIRETLDYFPLPVQMREMYVGRGIPPATTFGEMTPKED